MSPRIRISIPCLQKHFIIFLLFGGNFLSSAQTYNSPEIDNKVGTYISQLVSIWNQYNTVDFTEYFQQPVKKKTDSTLLVRNTFLNSNGSKNDLCIQRNLLGQQILRRKSGLELTSSFYRNYRSPVADPADITSYKYRLTFGVNWDILRGGVYENRVKLKSMKGRIGRFEKKTSH